MASTSVETFLGSLVVGDVSARVMKSDSPPPRGITRRHCTDVYEPSRETHQDSAKQHVDTSVLHVSLSPSVAARTCVVPHFTTQAAFDTRQQAPNKGLDSYHARPESGSASPEEARFQQWTPPWPQVAHCFLFKTPFADGSDKTLVNTLVDLQINKEAAEAKGIIHSLATAAAPPSSPYIHPWPILRGHQFVVLGRIAAEGSKAKRITKLFSPVGRAGRGRGGRGGGGRTVSLNHQQSQVKIHSHHVPLEYAIRLPTGSDPSLGCGEQQDRGKSPPFLFGHVQFTNCGILEQDETKKQPPAKSVEWYQAKEARLQAEYKKVEEKRDDLRFAKKKEGEDLPLEG
ncbi:hypothetical protein PG993_004040 [Apiospora rasikravindrae]|uniref:Uncharacterized protein n=1 Tax=Apiospora rasikravindrae TaxID=990691 RepID=A0ABR1TDE2_9PEZI